MGIKDTWKEALKTYYMDRETMREEGLAAKDARNIGISELSYGNPAKKLFQLAREFNKVTKKSQKAIDKAKSEVIKRMGQATHKEYAKAAKVVGKTMKKGSKKSEK